MSRPWGASPFRPALLIFLACIPIVTSLKVATEANLTELLLWSAHGQHLPAPGKSEVSLHNLDPLPAHGKGGSIQLASLSVCLFLFGSVCMHEGAVHLFGKPPFLSSVGLDKTRKGLQGSYLLWWVFLMMDPSVLIPTSYELSQEMDCTAAVSGLLLGSGYLLTPLGCIGGAFLYKWCSMTSVRLVAVISTFILMAQNLIHAVALDSQTEHGPETMWFLIALRFFCGLGKMSYVCQYVAYNVTPKSHRIGLSVMVAVATNTGLCLGPLLSAGSIHLLGGREAVASVYSRSSAPLYFMAILWAVLGIAFALTMPTNITPYLPDESRAAVVPNDASKSRIHRLTLEERKSIVMHGLEYALERAVAVAAIEAGTAMILETEFRWGSEAIGFTISMVFATTIVVCAIIMVANAKSLIKDVNGMLFMACVSAGGTFLLFDFHTGYAFQVLLADVLIYPFMYCASAVADGIVTGLAVPDTWFSLESYLALKNSGMALGRFAGFPLARYLIDSGGRNLYAGLQALLAILGLIAVVKIAWILQFSDFIEATPRKSGPATSESETDGSSTLHTNTTAHTASNAP